MTDRELIARERWRQFRTGLGYHAVGCGDGRPNGYLDGERQEREAAACEALARLANSVAEDEYTTACEALAETVRVALRRNQGHYAGDREDLTAGLARVDAALQAAQRGEK